MQKNIFFLAGLPRSGATLLSSILNQNSDISATPASPLFLLMQDLESIYHVNENVDYEKNSSIARVISYSPHVFYADNPSNNILDKNLNWATPKGLELIYNYITDKPKIICCVRNIVDILVSFDTIVTSVKGNENNIIDKLTLENTFNIKPMADRRSDFLMQYDQNIQRCINGMMSIYLSEYKDCLLFIEYENLIQNTKNEIQKIYNFLNIKHFEHEYQNIVDPTNISENSLTGIKYLHKVRPKIEKISKNPKEILMEETIRRYSGLEFWRREV